MTGKRGRGRERETLKIARMMQPGIPSMTCLEDLQSHIVIRPVMQCMGTILNTQGKRVACLNVL